MTINERVSDLIHSEIADFFAGFGSPGEPDIQSGEAQRQLIARIDTVLQQCRAAAELACPKCGGTGMADSGGVQPWGAPIFIECDCHAAPQLPLPAPEKIAMQNFRTAMEGIGHIRRTLEETFGGLHGTHCEPDVLVECKVICDAICAAYHRTAPQVTSVPDVGTAHSSIIAEQLEHILSGMDVTDHQRAVIICAVDRLNNNAEMLQKAPYAPAAQEAILYEPSPTDSANAPLKFTDVEDRAWVVGAEWMRDAFKRENPHLRIANDDDPAPQLPQPAVVPDAIEIDDDFDSAFEHGKAVGWNAYRAAMLQGAEPVSQPYTLPEHSPCADAPDHIWLQTAGEWPASGEFSELTWSCDNQHPDDTLYVRADLVGKSPGYLQGYKDGCEWSALMAEANHPQTGDWLFDDPIELAKAIRKGPDMLPVEPDNSPAIPDGWIPVSERLPDDDDFVYIWPRPDFGVELHVGQYCKFHKKGAGWYAQVNEQNYGIEWYRVTVTHWMPLPAAPQQEAE